MTSFQIQVRAVTRPQMEISVDSRRQPLSEEVLEHRIKSHSNTLLENNMAQHVLKSTSKFLNQGLRKTPPSHSLSPPACGDMAQDHMNH